VTLAIQAADNAGRVVDMSFSNDGGSSWSAWQPYAPQTKWTLSTGEGQKTVQARTRDEDGNVSSTAQASVVLDLTPPTGSIVIQASTAGGQSTDSPVRALTLSAFDNVSPASRIQMRLANRADLAGSAWQSLASQVTWDFTGGGTVYVQFRDEAGNVSTLLSRSLPGAAPPGTSPAPVCSPRPPVTVTAQPSNGTLAVTVRATGPNNGLRAVRFDSFANALVDVGSQQGQTAPFIVSIPAGQEPASIAFVVRRQTAGQPTTVRLVVVDGCGEWSTFVGGGPSAF
jgi:hypothetical protein